MSILLVRHGETASNVARVLQTPETPLHERGLRQASLLAPRLAQLGVEQILCSDLTRAQMTAEPLARITGLPVVTSELLQERNFGELRGLPYSQLGGDPFAPGFAPPGGETWEQFHARTDRAFELIVQSSAALRGNLVVITHGLLCWSIVNRRARMPNDAAPPGRFDNASLSILDDAPPHWVRLANCTAHLADEDTGASPAGGAA
ncbi:MAG TPA: histidine phosphatase family protein [Polyangiales bacterium]